MPSCYFDTVYGYCWVTISAQQT